MLMVWVPVVWAQYEPGYTNKPVPFADTILIPHVTVPQVNVPQATVIEIPMAGTPQPPVVITPSPKNSPFKPAAAYPHPTTADLARRNVQIVAPPLPPLQPAVAQVPLPAKVAPPVPTAKPLPEFSTPILFNTLQADAILAVMQIFPSNNLWHADISQWPVHPHSTGIIDAVGAWRPLEFNQDMGFVIVPQNAPRTNVKLSTPVESDLGPYPLPENLPIEGWPVVYQRSEQFNSLTLDDVQRDVRNLGGDRHAIVVDPNDQKLYEFWVMRKTAMGWQAGQASIFDLSSNKLRPDGWTSADAAGLPIFPAVVRYDELVRGEIDHALRVTVPQTRRAYVAPATHFASKLTDENLPRMGERLRLRQSYYIETFSPEVRTILKALKKHGMFVADNGGMFAISIAPDERIPDVLSELNRVTAADFEIVTTPN